MEQVASPFAGIVGALPLPLAALFWLLALRALYRIWLEYRFSKIEFYDKSLAEETAKLPRRHPGRWALALTAAAVLLSCLAAVSNFGVWP
ncbi:TPA: hypothetical protein NIA45_004794 [Pseudomonas aeruginosa]|nr:hypothetical protein [Pseudomonas aeruginosa]